MKKLFCIFTIMLFTVAATQAPAAAQGLLKVCANPATPCKSKLKEFAPYELSMMLPARVKQNTPYKSEVFFAVMVKDAIRVAENEECDGGEFHKRIEAERQQLQKLFPNNKVFAGHQCPDMAAIGYLINNQPHNENFIAVYGGATMEAATMILQAAKLKYPKATIKKMQAVFENIVQ